MRIGLALVATFAGNFPALADDAPVTPVAAPAPAPRNGPWSGGLHARVGATRAREDGGEGIKPIGTSVQIQIAILRELNARFAIGPHLGFGVETQLAQRDGWKVGYWFLDPGINARVELGRFFAVLGGASYVLGTRTYEPRMFSFGEQGSDGFLHGVRIGVTPVVHLAVAKGAFEFGPYVEYAHSWADAESGPVTTRSWKFGLTLNSWFGRAEQ